MSISPQPAGPKLLQYPSGGHISPRSLLGTKEDSCRKSPADQPVMPCRRCAMPEMQRSRAGTHRGHTQKRQSTGAFVFFQPVYRARAKGLDAVGNDWYIAGLRKWQRRSLRSRYVLTIIKEFSYRVKLYRSLNTIKSSLLRWQSLMVAPWQYYGGKLSKNHPVSCRT